MPASQWRSSSLSRRKTPIPLSFKIASLARPPALGRPLARGQARLVTAFLHRMESMMASGLLGQLIRFGVAGGITTGLYMLVYSPLAAFKITSEQVANVCGYLVAMFSGYLLHSKWSFRGHGAEAKQTSWRFFLVSLVSYVLNT